MINTTNFTKFGMDNDAERYLWAVYNLLIFLTSLIGDTLILVASFQKGAIKVNKSILTIMQHIAVSDLAISMSRVFPTTISLFSNSWSLGDTLCYANVYLKYNTYTTGIILIAFLTTTKLLLIKYPRQSMNWTTKRVNQACIFFWILPVTIPVPLSIVDKDDIFFDYRTYNCAHGFNHSTAQKLTIPFAVLFTFVPNIIVVVTTIPTLQYLNAARKSARRSGGGVPRRGAWTVPLTAVVYCVSSLPTSVYFISKPLTMDDPSGPFQFHLLRISHFISLINVTSNFFIYTSTIPSFRRFLELNMPALTRITEATEEGQEMGESNNNAQNEEVPV